MRLAGAARSALSILLLISPTICQQPEVNEVQVDPRGEGWRVGVARMWDVNGDGARDLVLVAGRARTIGSRKVNERQLRLHHSRAGAQSFRSEPDSWTALPADVVGFAPADVHVDEGVELVLFTPRGVFAWRVAEADEAARFELLFEAELLWQDHQVRSAHPLLHAVRDLNSDGLADILVPEPRGYRVAFQSEARGEDGQPTRQFRQVSFLELPRAGGDLGRMTRFGELSPDAVQRDAHGSGDGLALGISMGASAPGGPQTLVSVRAEVPAPQVLDWDADGDLDVLAQGKDELWVWKQRDDGSYRSAPDVVLEMPATRGEVQGGEGRGLDISYSSHALELDRDSRADCIIVVGDKRSRAARTQLMVFHGKQDGALFGDDGVPDGLLVLAGLGGFPRFIDVDGDRDLDLVVTSFRPDLVDALRSAASRTVELGLYVFLNDGGSYPRRPQLATDLSVPVDSDGFSVNFPGDTNGDGISELLVREHPERLVLYPISVRRGEWSVGKRSTWELRVHEDAELSLEDASGRAAPELCVVEKSAVVVVRWNRRGR